MLNFSYYNPVRIVFGKDTIQQLAQLIPQKSNVLFTYEGGPWFFKQKGVYEQVMAALKGFTIYEFSGIEANPTYETCMQAVELAKEKEIDFILAVGGGSVIDASKFIALAIKYREDDPWDFLSKGVEIDDAVAVGCILTLPATGSEMNCNTVVSRESTQEKLINASPYLFPKFSILDPETTFTLPERQITNGVADTFVHTMEQYMTYDVKAPLQARQAEAIIQTLLEEAPQVFDDPTNYDTRASLMWAATLALNGMIRCGVPEDWTSHQIGHELTALYGIDHAQSVSIPLTAVWRHQKKRKAERLFQFGKRIYGINDRNKSAIIDETIKKTEDFFDSIHMMFHLKDYNIDAVEAADKIYDRFTAKGIVCGEYGDISPEQVKEIILKCQ